MTEHYKGYTVALEYDRDGMTKRATAPITGPRYLVYHGEHFGHNRSFRSLPEARRYADKLAARYCDVHIHDTWHDLCLSKVAA
jgi:hypothetical protein